MALLRAALILLLLATPASAFFFHTGGGTVAPPSGIALTRTILQPTATTTPVFAFKMLGQPFKGGPDFNGAPPEVPSGDILTATLAGHPIRVAECNQGGPMTHTDGSMRWARLLIDYSVDTGTGLPITITPSNTTGATLQFAATPGSWPAGRTNAASDADWQAMGDTVTMSNVTVSIAGLTGTSGTGYTLPAGQWTASFNSSAQIIHVCTSSVGNIAIVKAPFISDSDGTTPHNALFAVMEYWVTETSGGAAGPIYSRGPFIWNTYLNKAVPAGSGITCSSTRTICPSAIQADFAWTRGGLSTCSQFRAYGLCAWIGIGVWPMTAAQLMRPDADWDCWYSSALCTASGAGSADNDSAWIWEDYTKVRATHAIPPYADGIPSYYNPPALGVNSISPVYTAVTAYDNATGRFTLANYQSVVDAGDNTSGLNQVPSSAIEFNVVTNFTGISANTPYFICHPSGLATGIQQIYSRQIDSFACGSTGQIKPTLTGSISGSMTATLDVAPETIGITEPTHTGPGARPELFPIPEWSIAYLVAPITAIAGSTFNAHDSRRFARVQTWLDWSNPQHVLDDATGSVFSWLSPTMTASCCGSLPNMFGGTGITSNINMLYNSIKVFPAAINGALGPTGGYGLFDAAAVGGCQVTNGAGCGNIDAQHYPGPGEWPIWLLEGDPLMQMNLQILTERGMDDAAYGALFRTPPTIGGTTYYSQYLDNACTRCSAHAGWNMAIGAYAAAEGSAEQALWRQVIQHNVDGTNAYMSAQTANYRSLFMITHNPTNYLIQSVGAGISNDGIETFQNAYVQWGLIETAILDSEFVLSLKTLVSNASLFLSYPAVIGWGGAAGFAPGCSYFATAYFSLPGLNDSATSGSGAYPSNINDVMPDLANPGYGFYFTSGSPNIASAQWAAIPNTGTNPPAVGDLVRFYNWNSFGGQFNGAPTGFSDLIDYCIVGVGPGASYIQVSSTCGGAAITASNAGASITGFIDDGLGGGSYDGVSGNVLTVTAVSSGTIATKNYLRDDPSSNVPANTIVSGLGTGTGGTGTYTLNQNMAVAPEAMATHASANLGWMPGPNQSCPTGSLVSNVGVPNNYMAYITGWAGAAQAAQSIGVVNLANPSWAPSNPTPAETAYQSTLARWATGGIPNGCTSVGYMCMGDHW